MLHNIIYHGKDLFNAFDLCPFEAVSAYWEIDKKNGASSLLNSSIFFWAIPSKNKSDVPQVTELAWYLAWVHTHWAWVWQKKLDRYFFRIVATASDHAIWLSMQVWWLASGACCKESVMAAWLPKPSPLLACAIGAWYFALLSILLDW